MNIWQLETEYLRRVAADPVMTALSRKIDRGAATFAETAQYSERMSNLLGETLSKHITEIPEHERAAICEELLKGRYTDINEQLEAVQKALDRANGINIAPQRAKFPTERVRKVAGALMDTTASDEVIRRRANAPVANVSKSFHDDYMKRNAEFRSRAGLQCYIDREAAPGCCAWCSEIAGRYEYGDEPKDVYRRHDNCSCITTYENGRQRQDVWSKKEWEAPEPGAGAAPLTVFDDETRPDGFQPKELGGLQNDSNDDILRMRGMAQGGRRSIHIPLSDDDKKHLLNEIEAIKANPDVFIFRDGLGSGYDDERDIIYLSSNIFPSNDDSLHPRDRMSERAAIAHEYYGHRAYRGTEIEKGEWNDEFRASYMAAKNCPNLSSDDRRYLILDALERAKEAGVTIQYNDFIRRVLYG